jgi:hypothetical protein
MLGVCAVVVLVCATATAGADAAKTGVQLTEGGTPVAVGAKASAGVALFGDCYVFTGGTLAKNGKPSDTASLTTPEEAHCFGEGEVSGQLKHVKVTASGEYLAKGVVLFSVTGQCVYKFTTFKASLVMPGQVLVEGATTGKLMKSLSEGSCAATLSETFQGDLGPAAETPPWEAELIG